MTAESVTHNGSGASKRAACHSCCCIDSHLALQALLAGSAWTSATGLRNSWLTSKVGCPKPPLFCELKASLSHFRVLAHHAAISTVSPSFVPVLGFST